MIFFLQKYKFEFGYTNLLLKYELVELRGCGLSIWSRSIDVILRLRF